MWVLFSNSCITLWMPLVWYFLWCFSMGLYGQYCSDVLDVSVRPYCSALRRCAFSFIWLLYVVSCGNIGCGTVNLIKERSHPSLCYRCHYQKEKVKKKMLEVIHTQCSSCIVSLLNTINITLQCVFLQIL